MTKLNREMPQAIPFLKMHGAGNDFVVIDNRSGASAFSTDEIIRMADRRLGIGCDQVVLIERSAIATVFMRLYNADGSEVAACGNATRCVGWLMMEETGKPRVTIETKAGVLTAEKVGEMRVKVDMGAPRFDWREIPLASEADTENLPVALGLVQKGCAVNIGNPHAVFFVDDVVGFDLAKHGAALETHQLFPERTNVEIVQVNSPTHLQVRVWERGAGLTLACGTGACAAMVVARLRGLVEGKATVSLPGGDLEMEWSGKGDTIKKTGPVAISFKGEWVKQ